MIDKSKFSLFNTWKVSSYRSSSILWTIEFLCELLLLLRLSHIDFPSRSVGILIPKGHVITKKFYLTQTNLTHQLYPIMLAPSPLGESDHYIHILIFSEVDSREILLLLFHLHIKCLWPPSVDYLSTKVHHHCLLSQESDYFHTCLSVVDH